MTTSALPTLLTASETCDALRISRSTLGRLVARGDLRAVKLGNAPGAPLRFPVSELERILSIPSGRAA